METATPTATGDTPIDRVRARVTGLARGDDHRDLLRVLGVLGLFVVIDRATRALAESDYADLGDWSLTGASLAHRPVLTGLAVLTAIALAVWRPRRLFARWDQLEHGSALRVFVAIVIVFVVWRFAFYDYNWLADTWHGFDRGLVVMLGIGAVLRPALLPVFVVVVRAVTEQFINPLGFEIAANIQDLPVLVLIMVSAGFALYVISGDRRTDPLPLLLATTVAAHFFVPGFEKLRSGWVGDNELANLPHNALAQGWGASGDGSRADTLADAMDSARWVFVIGTLLLELGIVFALVHRNLIRLWLAAAVGFHLATFAVMGFVFLDWVVVEIALVGLLSVPAFAPWVRRSFRPGRVIVVAGVLVALASTLFHPPNLAWFDAPAAYAYRIDVDVAGGDSTLVQPDDLSPYVQELAFSMLELGPSTPAVGGYGAASREQFDRLDAVEDFDELADLEATLRPPAPIDQEAARFFLLAFVRASHRDQPSAAVPGPPHEFQIDLPGPNYAGEPIERLRVSRVTTLRVDGDDEQRVEPVLEIAMVEGEATLVG